MSIKPLIKAWKLDLSSTQSSLTPLPISPETDSLNQVSQSLPAGAYTTLRTYACHQVLRLEAHFQRLEDTASLAGQPLRLDRAAVRGLLRQAVAQFPAEREVRLRLTLDLQDQPGMLYLSAEVLKTPPPQAYRSGVKLITCKLQRLLPKAKLTRFITRADKVRQALPPSVNEALMVTEDGRLLEGLSSNFFGVLKGEIWTAEEGVLSGTTRQLALEAAASLGISVHRESLSMADLPGLDEAFITSASREILPVRQIDEVRIGTSCPGRVTRRLMNEFAHRLLSEVEPF